MNVTAPGIKPTKGDLVAYDKTADIALIKIDYDNLFAEFKTILKRELSKEDKKIINIAYNMGRKNKFLSNNNKK